MQVRIKKDSIEIEGYVNAVERYSRTLRDRIGDFIEKVCKGAFGRAIQRNDNIKILLNHDSNRELGNTKDGSLKLKEDNIGLYARATIYDKEVIENARNDKLVGWSFGFYDIDVERKAHNGIDCRTIKDLDLREVSILNDKMTPAYEGTLIQTRAEDLKEFHIRSETEEVEMLEENIQEPTEEEKTDILSTKIANKVVEMLKEKQEEASDEDAFNVEEESQKDDSDEVLPKQQEIVDEIDYSETEKIIKEMKEEM